MCKLCSYNGNGEQAYYWNSMIKKNVDFGLSNMSFEVTYCHSEEDDEIGDKLNLEVCLNECLDDMIVDEYVSINYCPLCGRKLN